MTTKTYAMYEGNEETGEQDATTPAQALKAYFGDKLASSKGRYGRLTNGLSCAALLSDKSNTRARYADHGTTRSHI